MRQKCLSARAMTRHILALLALLSGLAALSGTAHASSAGPLAAKRLDAPDKAARRCLETRRTSPVPRPRVLRMPVLMGVERALE